MTIATPAISCSSTICIGVDEVILSPVFGQLHPRNLAEWILRDGLDVRLGLQIHKFIWDPDTRGV